jgi:hypothetical protein
MDWADRLAYSIAPVDVIGEHSNLNDPWQNAIDHLEGERQIAAALSPAATPSPDAGELERHVHEGRWCRACLTHGADTMLAGMVEAEQVRAALEGAKPA